MSTDEHVESIPTTTALVKMRYIAEAVRLNPGRSGVHDQASAEFDRWLAQQQPQPAPGPLRWKFDGGRGAMLDEANRIVGYWTPPAQPDPLDATGSVAKPDGSQSAVSAADVERAVDAGLTMQVSLTPTPAQRAQYRAFLGHALAALGIPVRENN